MELISNWSTSSLLLSLWVSECAHQVSMSKLQSQSPRSNNACRALNCRFLSPWTEPKRHQVQKKQWVAKQNLISFQKPPTQRSPNISHYVPWQNLRIVVLHAAPIQNLPDPQLPRMDQIIPKKGSTVLNHSLAAVKSKQMNPLHRVLDR